MAEIIRRAIDTYLAWDDPTYSPVPKPQERNAHSSPPSKDGAFWAINCKHLLAEAMKQVEQTIKILKLNDSTCIRGRRSWLQPYLDEIYGIAYLEEKAPFLASELKRQNLTDVNLPVWEHFRKASLKRLS